MLFGVVPDFDGVVVVVFGVVVVVFGVVVAGMLVVVAFGVVEVVVEVVVAFGVIVELLVVAAPVPSPVLLVAGTEEVGAGVAPAAGSGPGNGWFAMPAIYSVNPSSLPSWRYL